MHLRAILLLLIVFTSGAQAESRFALLIGTQVYNEKVGPLKNPHNDIALVGAALEKVGFKVTRIKDAGYRAIDTALKRHIQQVRRAGKDTMSFVVRMLIHAIAIAIGCGANHAWVYGLAYCTFNDTSVSVVRRVALWMICSARRCHRLHERGSLLGVLSLDRLSICALRWTLCARYFCHRRAHLWRDGRRTRLLLQTIGHSNTIYTHSGMVRSHPDRTSLVSSWMHGLVALRDVARCAPRPTSNLCRRPNPAIGCSTRIADMARLRLDHATCRA